jgi:chromosome segregation ATPase
LREIIEAPEPILVYLCIYSKLHMVPVGDDSSQRNISNILDQISKTNITRLYTSTHMYNMTKSRYTGKITTSSQPISESFWLDISLDQAKLEELEAKEKELITKLKKLDAELRSIQESKSKMDRDLDVLRDEKNKLNERMMHIERLAQQIKSKTELLKLLEGQNIDLVAECKKKLEKIEQICKQR